VAVGVLAAGLALAPVATAAETFGSNLTASAVAFNMATGTSKTLANDSLPVGSRAPGGFTSPIDGVVVRWRIKVGSPGTGPVALQVTRPGNSTTRTSVATSATVTPPVGATTTFETQLPAQAGDALALGFPDGTSIRAVAVTVGPSLIAWTPRLQDGEAPRASFLDETDRELLINADVEADCDGDGFGDETQDANTSSCHPRALTLDANKSKVKKGKKVRLSGQVLEASQAGAACVANQAVELQRKKPSQTTFTTVEQLQTDAAGSFSTKEKVKKTFEYRAQVAETAICGNGLSNTEKVKAKKK
jgi:hypothetical protein